MTSIGARTRQANADGGYYIAISSCANVIFSSPLGSVAPWADASVGSTSGALGLYSTAVSTVNRAGTLFRDMGKTVVSSGAFFRKVQLVVPQAAAAAGQVGTGSANGSTFGVGGPLGAGTGVPDFYTGYIKLGFEGQGPNAPVASFGR